MGPISPPTYVKDEDKPLSGSVNNPLTPASMSSSSQTATSTPSAGVTSTSSTDSSVKRPKLTLTWKNGPRHWKVVRVTRTKTRSNRIRKILFRREPAPPLPTPPPTPPQTPPPTPIKQEEDEKEDDDTVIEPKTED